ncbi:MAG: ATP phosphoribosyltransferase regulatory subunit [Cucumibacter sp.]
MSADARRAALKQLVDETAGWRAAPAILQPADLYFDLAGEAIGARLLLTSGEDGTEYCLRPEFTLAVAAEYLTSELAGTGQAIGYLGPVFRQRQGGPAEFEQAGLEFLGPVAGDPFDRSLAFAFAAAKIYGVDTPELHLGAVDLFEALLAGVDMPDMWRPRIRARFGHKEALAQLLDRLAAPETTELADRYPAERGKLIAVIASEMEQAGLSPISGREAAEIADRHLEKRALAAARVPEATVQILRLYLGIAGEARAQLSRLEKLAVDASVDLAALVADTGLDLREPIARLASRINAIAAHFKPGIIRFDAAFSPPLDYYTGHVFELVAPKTKAIIASGGRYDRLLERLGSAKPIPAVGCAVWLDRLEEAGS